MPTRPPGLRIGGRKPTKRSMSTDTVSGGPTRVRIPTRIGRATGSSDRFALSAVRALPLVSRGRRRGRPTKAAGDPPRNHNAMLQATDGHQAVCVLTQGHVESATLVPGKALPTKYAGGRAGVSFADGRWRSSDGREASPVQGTTDFPSVGSVLPDVVKSKRAGKDASRRRGARGMAAQPITLAVSVDRLRRVAAGLGTDTVTLLVTANPSEQSGSDGNTVTAPIAVCPADDDAPDGVAVMLPVPATRGADYYARLRAAVLDAEKAAGVNPVSKGVAA